MKKQLSQANSRVVNRSKTAAWPALAARSRGVKFRTIGHCLTTCDDRGKGPTLRNGVRVPTKPKLIQSKPLRIGPTASHSNATPPTQARFVGQKSGLYYYPFL